MVFMESTMVPTDVERIELSQRATSRSGRADDARRARLLLLLEEAILGPRFATSWTAMTRLSLAGAIASRKNGWQGCSAGTLGKRPAP
jgi:hypothetical protein